MTPTITRPNTPIWVVYISHSSVSLIIISTHTFTLSRAFISISTHTLALSPPTLLYLSLPLSLTRQSHSLLIVVGGPGNVVSQMHIKWWWMMSIALDRVFKRSIEETTNDFGLLCTCVCFPSVSSAVVIVGLLFSVDISELVVSTHTLSRVLISLSTHTLSFSPHIIVSLSLSLTVITLTRYYQHPHSLTNAHLYSYSTHTLTLSPPTLLYLSLGRGGPVSSNCPAR
jgi:hypothetical protein